MRNPFKTAFRKDEKAPEVSKRTHRACLHDGAHPVLGLKERASVSRAESAWSSRPVCRTIFQPTQAFHAATALGFPIPGRALLQAAEVLPHPIPSDPPATAQLRAGAPAALHHLGLLLTALQKPLSLWCAHGALRLSVKARSPCSVQHNSSQHAACSRAAPHRAACAATPLPHFYIERQYQLPQFSLCADPAGPAAPDGTQFAELEARETWRCQEGQEQCPQRPHCCTITLPGDIFGCCL